MYTPLAEHLPLFPPGEDTDALKARFAVAFCRNPNDAYQAAKQIEANPGRASYMAAYWPADPYVIERMERETIDRGSAAFLPTKDEFALKVWQLAEESRTADAKLNFLKLFGSTMGYVEKPAERGNVNVAIVNKVMSVPVFADKDEARHAIAAQQAKLINSASA